MYRAALASGDFEAAAEHVGRYLQLDRQFSSVTDELDSRQLAEQRAVRLSRTMLINVTACSPCAHKLRAKRCSGVVLNIQLRRWTSAAM